jgi:quinol monooxygenase YgiN
MHKLEPHKQEAQVDLTGDNRMGKLALIVEYETLPGNEEAFDVLIRAHAKACLAEEPGCLRFEVLRPFDDVGNRIPNRFMASEIFVDNEALYAHRATERWKAIAEKFKEMLVSRRPVLCEADDSAD